MASVIFSHLDFIFALAHIHENLCRFLLAVFCSTVKPLYAQYTEMTCDM